MHQVQYDYLTFLIFQQLEQIVKKNKVAYM